jgi:hypothetical protein
VASQQLRVVLGAEFFIGRRPLNLPQQVAVHRRIEGVEDHPPVRITANALDGAQLRGRRLRGDS